MHCFIKIILLLLFLCSSLSPAISQLSKGGLPYSSVDEAKFDSIEVVSVLPQNNRALKSVYAPAPVSPSKNEALKFAHPLPLYNTIENSGSWTMVDDTTLVWRLAFQSKGAYSLSLLFDKFVMPPSGKLFVYNSDKSTILGAFTKLNNRDDSLFMTAPIAGDIICLEYTQSLSETVKPILSISQLNHDFLNVFKSLGVKVTDSFGMAGDCNVDVTDDANYNSMPQVRSVCKLLIGGTELCSGTMLANTADETSVYVITAGHCIETTANASTTLFYYNYESPHGESSIKGSLDFQTYGSTVVARATNTDFALVKLATEKPASYFMPYLSGWNRSVSPPSPAYAIHHPSGDVKKISRTKSILEATTYEYLGMFLPNYHWRVEEWSSGTTESGSSGCGLFDNNGTLVGTLSGGSASCGYSYDDYFVRFEKIWNGTPEPNLQLQAWLDPSNISTTLYPFMGRELYKNEKPRRISSVSASDSAIFKTVAPEKYKVGVYLNSASKKVAQQFLNLATKNVEGLFLATSKRSVSGSGKIKLSFYDGMVAPENLLLEMADIPLSTLNERYDKFIPLPNRLNVATDNLFVAYELMSPVAGDTLSLFYSTHDKFGVARSTNNVILYNGTTWSTFSTVYPGVNASLWLDLVISDQLDNSLDENGAEALAVEVFPNPNTGEFFVEIKEDGHLISNVEAVTLDGVRYDIQPKYISSSKIQVLLPAELRGVILLKIICNDVSITKRVLKY